MTARRIYGLDLTSVPTRRKPITCAQCRLVAEGLWLERTELFADFAAFETFLRREGSWVAGLDAPFGQPRKLVENLDYPRIWEGYAARFGELSRAEFVRLLTDYKEKRAIGDKEHRRATDAKARSQSPMKLYGVPVGKMFYEVAPRLAQSPINIPLLRPTRDARTAIEAYPALVARTFIGSRSYKSDTKRKQTPEQQGARAALVTGLLSAKFDEYYGFRLRVTSAQQAELVADPKADVLDALLCAVQAAWAARQPAYGIPGRCARGLDH